MVSQLVNRKGNPVRNHFIIKTKKGVYFQSYKSVVCKLDGINIALSSNWGYSNTTRKHLYEFLRQNGFYQLCSASEIRKAIKEGRIVLNNVPSLDIQL